MVPVSTIDRLLLAVQSVLELDDPTNPDHRNTLLSKQNRTGKASDVVARVAPLMTAAAMRGDEALAVVATNDLNVDTEQIGHNADGEQCASGVAEDLLPVPVHGG